MLRVEQVSKRFLTESGPVDALRSVDLRVEPSSFSAVLGASGSGKTTLLRIIAGFECPDAGTVTLDGSELSSAGSFLPPERRNVGIVAQDGALFPHLDVHENIAYGLRPGRRGWPFGSRRQGANNTRVNELLELVGLSGYGTRRPNELSGGQQQRVALARALAPNPGLLLMDEPFSALDAGLRLSIREEVRDLLARLGTTVVLVTHDQNEALSMADQVVVMREGAVIQTGSPTSVYAKPVDLTTAAFLGAAVILPAEALVSHGVSDVMDLETPLGVVQVKGGAPTGTDGDNLRVVLRPEQLVLDTTGVPGTVRSVSFFGHDGTARVVLERSKQEVTLRMLGLDLPNPGDRVGVAIERGAQVQIL